MDAVNLPDLAGRVAVITGASGGIGLWTAAGLAKAGAKTVLVCRDAARGDAARGFVAKQAGVPKPDLVLADFADLRNVAAAADTLLDRYPSVHILVNNAGLFAPKRELTVDGYETTFAVNHLAPFLLTTRLLPSIRRAGGEGRIEARIVTVSSIASRTAKLAFDDLMSSKRYSMLGSYSTSKLANILFTKELARRLQGHPVSANCLHPGVVATNIGNKGGVFSFVWSALKPFVLSPEQGAVNSLFVAASPAIEGVSGEFFVKQKAAAPNPIALDPRAATRLWEESERLVAAAIAGGIPTAARTA